MARIGLDWLGLGAMSLVFGAERSAIVFVRLGLVVWFTFLRAGADRGVPPVPSQPSVRHRHCLPRMRLGVGLCTTAVHASTSGVCHVPVLHRQTQVRVARSPATARGERGESRCRACGGPRCRWRRDSWCGSCGNARCWFGDSQSRCGNGRCSCGDVRPGRGGPAEQGKRGVCACANAPAQPVAARTAAAGEARGGGCSGGSLGVRLRRSCGMSSNETKACHDTPTCNAV